MVSYTKRHNRAWERKPKTFANEKSAKELERTWIVRLHFSRHLFHVWAVKQYFLHRSSLGLARHSFELLRSFLHRFRFSKTYFASAPFGGVFRVFLSLFATFTKNPPTTRGTRVEGLFSRVSFVRSLAPLSRVGLKVVVEKEFERNSSLGGSLGFSVIEIQEKIKCSKNNTSRLVTNTYRV